MVQSSLTGSFLVRSVSPKAHGANEMRRLTWILAGSIIGIVLIAGVLVAITRSDLLARAPRSTKAVAVQTEGIYELVPFDQMIAEADLIAVGQVAAISDPFWNQDGGDYWEPAPGETRLPVHTVAIHISQYLAGGSSDDPVVVTVIGNSPSGPNVTDDAGNQVIVGSDPAHQLQVGQQGVFFLRHTELAWRGGPKAVVYFMGYPAHSYLLLGDDGLYHGGPDDLALSLDDLIQMIHDLRP